MVMFINRAGQDELVKAGQCTLNGAENRSTYSILRGIVVRKFRSGLLDSVSGFWKTTLVWVRHEAVLFYSPGLGFHPASHTTSPSKYVGAVHAMEIS
jgi:hypothetical protein